jgi:pimeloyl-ACP methyl ester carboxylesterase
MISLALIALSAVGVGACVSSAAYTSKIEAANPEAEGRMLTVNGHGVNVLTAGNSGPPILMIHGASANAREFTWTLAPRLSADHRIFMADRPGHGYSERFDGAEQLGEQAAQMAGVLDQLAPGEKAVIVGHSFGGGVALRLALDRPDLVKGLVLIAPVTHDWGGGGQAWYNGISATPLVGPVFTQLVPTVGPAQVKAGIEGVFNPAPVPEGYFEKSAIGLLFRPPNFRANAQDVQALQKELGAQSPRYPELKVPIVVFSGSQDTVIKPNLHVGQLKKQVPVEVVILPDEGHMPHHAHGADVADAIRRLAINDKSR